MSEEKFQSVKKEKKCKCRISGVRKKKEIERKVPEEKKSKCFEWKLKFEGAICLGKFKIREKWNLNLL